ncbi:hypothetical protein H6P81_007105 [Aristolochia fimbriata]|uniref:Uncharacterized protein n=1 Tax=Aristolochia fimbriata TaxID=158543 RepID=A0AAV7F2Y2_ARIFI|nr:hypothetical protein H6P81_007105 [Aristolochia fimbriata]
MENTSLRRISTSIIKPSPEQANKPRLALTPWDLPIMSVRYIQKGLLFSSLPDSLVDTLKQSLSSALDIFFPLAGRLVTESNDDDNSSCISIDCNGAGAEFIHATADVTVDDVLSPVDVPPIVAYSFFPLNEAINHDGHFLPLFAVQLTVLRDGHFIGCSFNHAIADGSGFWHFFATWAEIARNADISRPPVTQRWFSDGRSEVRLPFRDVTPLLERSSLPPLRDRFFHFSRESVSRLKARANEEAKAQNMISSFQALSALTWRSIVRAVGLPRHETTTCKFSIDTRSRLNPPLSRDYFGNALGMIRATVTVEELLERELGWAAALLRENVAAHTDAVVRGALDAWLKSPMIHRFSDFDGRSVLTGSSPRFDVYGVDFGWGSAAAVRSGIDNKFAGKITAFPGKEGIGSVFLEICLPSAEMSALESDAEFVEFIDH